MKPCAARLRRKKTQRLHETLVAVRQLAFKITAFYFDLSGNSAGVYFVTIQGANGIKTEKIILQK